MWQFIGSPEGQEVFIETISIPFSMSYVYDPIVKTFSFKNSFPSKQL